MKRSLTIWWRYRAAFVLVGILSGAGAGLRSASAQSSPAETPSPVEEVYLFRSLFERVTTSETEFCRREAPFRTTTENDYSLWSVASDAASGRVIDARRQRIGELRACVGVHQDGRVRLYAVGTINGIAFRGEGDQYASQQTDTVNSA